MDSLVTTEWLATALGARDLKVANASWFLPEHGRDARAEYDAAHIPGAVFLDLGSFADVGDPLPMMLPKPAQLASRMSALGLGDGCRIVLYDDTPLHSSARAWWMLTRFGTPDVAILDGGLAKWRAEGRPLEGGAAEAHPRHFTVRDQPQGVRSLADIRALVEAGDEPLIDARSPSRFAGEEPEPRAGVTPGHIPGSLNLHYARLFEADGRWKRGDALRAAFTDLGVDPERPMTITCGSGVTAAVLAFGAHLLGNDDVGLYDGSWSEWGADPATPKAKGRA